MIDAILAAAPSTGRILFVIPSTDTNYNDMADLLTPDTHGFTRLYPTITAALAACNSNSGDMIFISPGYTTAPTLTELSTAHTKGVIMQVLGTGTTMAHSYAYVPPTTLPASTYGTLFTVTGSCRILDIVGEVTTAIQAQACATKLTATPTVGSAVDLSSTLDINGHAVGQVYTITGTLATAMQTNANGVIVAQAASIVVPAGTIGLTTAATNTGAIKWLCRYIPLAPGASIQPI
jgi:hypothetical protein